MDSPSEEIKQLKQQIDTLQSTLTYYKQLCTNITKKVVKYDRITSRFTMIKHRFLFIISFLQYCGESSCVYGSTLRKYFEGLFHFHSFEPDDTTADVTNSDINVLLYHTNINTTIVDKVKLSSHFYTLLHSLNTSKIYSEHTHKHTSFFYYYKLIGIHFLNHTEKNGTIIPKAICYFKYKSDSLTVSILAWKPTDIVDFNVNQFIITHYGITSFYNDSFLQYLEHIYFKECQYMTPLNILQQHAFPPDACISRKDKLTHLIPLYSLMSHSYFKMISSGYTLLNYNCIQIEHEIDCFITGCKPPYPKVVLVCGHSISMMAYKGILLSTSDTDTQSIRCPVCRNDLKLYFETNVKRHKRLTYTPIHIQDITKLSQPNYTFISKDALEQL